MYNTATLKCGLRSKNSQERLQDYIKEIEDSLKALPLEQQEIVQVLVANIRNPELEEARYMFFSNMYDAALLFERDRQNKRSHTDFRDSNQAPFVNDIAKIIQYISIDQKYNLYDTKTLYLRSCMEVSKSIMTLLNTYPTECMPMYEKTKNLVKQHSNKQLVHFDDGNHSGKYNLWNIRIHDRFNDRNHSFVFYTTYEDITSESDNHLALAQ